jgi:hypothetical protein
MARRRTNKIKDDIFLPKKMKTMKKLPKQLNQLKAKRIFMKIRKERNF